MRFVFSASWRIWIHSINFSNCISATSTLTHTHGKIGNICTFHANINRWKNIFVRAEIIRRQRWWRQLTVADICVFVAIKIIFVLHFMGDDTFKFGTQWMRLRSQQAIHLSKAKNKMFLFILFCSSLFLISVKFKCDNYQRVMWKRRQSKMGSKRQQEKKTFASFSTIFESIFVLYDCFRMKRKNHRQLVMKLLAMKIGIRVVHDRTRDNEKSTRH